MTMNTKRAQVVDPILSTHARGYTNPELSYRELFPRVTIPERSMRVLKFGKEDFRLMNTRRAPGANVKRVTYGFSSDPVVLVQDALDAVVPREIQETAGSIPGVDVLQSAVNMVLNVVELGHEKAARDLALDASKYAASNKLALAGTDKWSDPAAKLDEQIEDAKLAVARRIGREPNTLFLGRDVFGAAKRNNGVKDQFKYTSSKSITVDMLASYFDVERVVVGRSGYLPEDAPEAADIDFVWGGALLLAYVNRSGSYLSPGFGYTYDLTGYPIVERPEWEKPIRSWTSGVTVERAPQLTGADAGFLFTSVL